METAFLIILITLVFYLVKQNYITWQKLISKETESVQLLENLNQQLICSSDLKKEL